jgi:hypothetical protein
MTPAPAGPTGAEPGRAAPGWRGDVARALAAGAAARLAYALVALPTRLASVARRTKAVPRDRPADAADRAHVGAHRLAAGVLGASATSRRRPGRTRALLGEVVALAIAAPAVAIFLVRGVAYPLVTTDASNSWGGPTIVGAWVAHLAVGLVQLGIVALVAGLLLRPSARATVSRAGG